MPPKRNIYSNNRDTITNRLKRVVGESQYAEKKAKKDLKIKSRKSMVALNEKTPNMMDLQQKENIANVPVAKKGKLERMGLKRLSSSLSPALPLPNVSSSNYSTPQQKLNRLQELEQLFSSPALKRIARNKRTPKLGSPALPATQPSPALEQRLATIRKELEASPEVRRVLRSRTQPVRFSPI